MVRQSTASASYPEFDHPGCPTSMDHFNDINTEFAGRLLVQAANKNCALDPAPTWIVKRFVDELAPFVVAYVNVSFQTGCFSTKSKRAIILPILKNSKLDRDDLNNYRPVSNLTFMSKILERCAYTQLYSYQNENTLLPEKQSAYSLICSLSSPPTSLHSFHAMRLCDHSAPHHPCQYVFLCAKPPWQPLDRFRRSHQKFGMHCRVIFRPSQLFLLSEELSNTIFSCLLILTVGHLEASRHPNVSRFMIRHHLLPSC